MLSEVRSYDPVAPLVWGFMSTRVCVLPPSVISMGVEAQLVLARGIGVMPWVVDQGPRKSSTGYGLLNSAEGFFTDRDRYQQQYASKASSMMRRTPPSTQAMTTTANRAESVQLNPA